MFDQLQAVPPIRLRSRSVIWTIDPGPLQYGYRIVYRILLPYRHGDIADEPSVAPPGFGLKYREWVILNRFRTSCIDGATVTHRLRSADNNRYS
jgi:hypothetical protein